MSNIVLGDPQAQVNGEKHPILYEGGSYQDLTLEDLTLNAEEIKLGAGAQVVGPQEISIGESAGSGADMNTALLVGRRAGFNKIGDRATIVGREAGRGHNGSVLVAFGNSAAQDGDGEDWVVMGEGAAEGANGNRIHAFGRNAAKNANGRDYVGIGNGVLEDATGTGIIAIGRQAGKAEDENDVLLINDRDGNEVYRGWLKDAQDENASDIELHNDGAGVIVTSEDGTERKRITVDNAGDLVAEEV